MSTLVNDPALSARLIAERHAHGADIFDEVWGGIYIMAPAPNDEHQSIATRLARVLVEAIEDAALGSVRSTINLASGVEDWDHDYRVPDLAVFMAETSAICHGAFWTGGPDFIIEIVSPYDQTREKLEFYRQVGAREVLIIDRDPWQLELLRLSGKSFASAGVATLEGPAAIVSDRLPLEFALRPASDRPRIEITHSRDGRRWTA